MVDVVLARPARSLPGDGWAFEPKWDGWRGLLTSDMVTSRQGKDLRRHFPELLGLLPTGTTLDGEIVCWRNGRLDFAGLHRRAEDASVCYVVFDLLEVDGNDLRARPYRERRAVLEGIALAPPLTLVESTADRAVALRWWEDYRAVGIEGLVAKKLDDPYRPGQRDWQKLRHRDTVDMVIIGLIGNPAAPTGVVLGSPTNAARPAALSLPLQRTLSERGRHGRAARGGRADVARLRATRPATGDEHARPAHRGGRSQHRRRRRSRPCSARGPGAACPSRCRSRARIGGLDPAGGY